MGQASRARHIRHRVFDRLRSASGHLKAFLLGESDRLDSTASARTFTANVNDTLTSNGHAFVTGKGPVVLATSGTLPAPLAVDTAYWPIRIDANTFYLATSRENAANGVRVNITDTGSGTHTASYATDAQDIMERMRQGVRYDTLKSRTDIDDV